MMSIGGEGEFACGPSQQLKPNSITLSGSNQLLTSFEPASNQLRAGSEPDSVTEFDREPASSC